MDELVDSTDNLISLHKHEEELRAQSLAEIKASADLSEHWSLVAEAMNAIYAFSHDHPHASENELTLQYLGIRLFNAAGASIKLAISGYYQKAFDQLRDVIETYFLVDYLSTYPGKIEEWKAADKKKRIAHFGPSLIRNALDKRDGYTSGERKKPVGRNRFIAPLRGRSASQSICGKPPIRWRNALRLLRPTSAPRVKASVARMSVAKSGVFR
jgi:hypothetical protein